MKYTGVVSRKKVKKFDLVISLVHFVIAKLIKKFYFHKKDMSGMNEALSDIAINAIYRVCIHSLGTREARSTGDFDKTELADCFERMVAAYKIVAPAVFKAFEFDEEGGK